MDILEVLIDTANKNVDFNRIEYTIGTRHVAASICGNIGVCATLGIHCNPINSKIDLDNIEHRIILNASVNACLNTSAQIDGYGDIFDTINFSSYKSICMIGYFDSLVNKLQKTGRQISIFDLDRTDVPTVPMELQAQHLSHSDCAIVTATTISNGTFSSIMSLASDSIHIFILGPSTPLSEEMFRIKQIKGLFGTRFKPNDHETLNAIANNNQFSTFKHNGEKVYLLNKLKNKL